MRKNQLSRVCGSKEKDMVSFVSFQIGSAMVVLYIYYKYDKLIHSPNEIENIHKIK